MLLQSFLDNLNQGFKCGSIEIAPYSQVDGFDKVLPTDTIIYVDFIADDEPVEGLAWDEYEKALELTDSFMHHSGYSQVTECDGSGGGLYYGFTAYRKTP